MAVHLGVEGPRAQRRATVAFRIVLAIPHYFLGALLGMVAFFVMVLAWSAALLVARVPHGIADLLARILQFQARMYGYGQLLLTDGYPPFTVGPADYAIELSFDAVGRFNRAAVLFRAILMLPALLVTQIVLAGALPAMIFFWLVTLVAGRLPLAAHMAFACVLRYQMRTYAYVGLVTTEYPSGLFGDADADVDLDEDLALPETPHVTRFVLSRAAKNLIILFLVLGSLLQVANVAVSFSGFLSGFDVANELDAHHEELLESVATWSATAQSCAVSGGPQCLRAANDELGLAVARFEEQLHALDLPDGAFDEADALLLETDDVRALLAQLSSVETADEYQERSLALQDALFRFDDRYEALYEATFYG